MAICPCLLDNIVISSHLPGVRQTNTSVMFDKYWQYFTTGAWHWMKEMQNVYESNRLSRSCLSPWRPRSIDMDNWIHSGLEYPNTKTGIRSVLGLCNIFRRFVPNLYCVAARLNKQVRKSQRQTFDGLADEETTALKKLKPKLVEPPFWVFHVCKAPISYINLI